MSVYVPNEPHLVAVEAEVRKISPFAFITGSQVIGGATTKSDIDICIPIWDKDSILNEYADRPCTQSAYNSSVKVELQGYYLNFLFLHPRDFLGWYGATNICKTFPLCQHLHKYVRYTVFEMLVSLCKLTITDIVISDNLAYEMKRFDKKEMKV